MCNTLSFVISAHTLITSAFCCRMMWGIFIVICAAPVFYFPKCAAIIAFDRETYKTSLCNCVVATINRYVAARNTITVASSITSYKKNVTTTIPMHQELLYYLSNRTRWTVLTTNMVRYRRITPEYTLAKISKSYVIFIKNVGEISTNLEKLRKLSSWNPHSRFFIVSATVFPDPHKVAYGILKTLWKQELLDGAVFLANPKNISQFHVYVSKPYLKGNCGKNLDTIEMIDVCFMGRFQNNTFLFRNNIPRRLNNCTLSVGVMKVEPFVMNTNNNPAVKNEHYRTDGIEINLLNTIANHLKLKLVYHEGDSGEIFINGTATGNLQLLKEGKIDVAVASYVKTFERCYHFDCSDTYLQDKLTWCVPHTPVLVYSFNFLDILDMPSWVLLVLVYLVAVGLIWFVSEINRKELTPYRDYRSVCQYVLSVSLGMPVRFQPRTSQIRTMFMCIVLFSFHLDSAYLTLLTSVVTGSRYEEKYGSTKDIYAYDLKTYFVPNTEQYFQEERLQFLRDKMIICDVYKDCMDHVALRRDSAFCVGQIYVDYVLDSYVTRSNDPLLYCFGNIVSMKMNLLMRKGFPLFSAINGLIRYVLSAGLIVKWKRDILRAKFGNFVADIDVGEGAGEFLRFKNLKPVFKALILCHCFAFFVFVVEFLRGSK